MTGKEWSELSDRELLEYTFSLVGFMLEAFTGRTFTIDPWHRRQPLEARGHVIVPGGPAPDWRVHPVQSIPHVNPALQHLVERMTGCQLVKREKMDEICDFIKSHGGLPQRSRVVPSSPPDCPEESPPTPDASSATNQLVVGEPTPPAPE